MLSCELGSSGSVQHNNSEKPNTRNGLFFVKKKKIAKKDKKQQTFCVSSVQGHDLDQRGGYEMRFWDRVTTMHPE